MLQAVLFKVKVVVDPVILVVRVVVLHLEVPWRVFFTSASIVPPECSLSIFESIFFNSCCFHVAVFKCPLIGSSSCVSRCDNIVKSFREIIKLYAEVRHSVHRVYVFRIGSFFPNLVSYASRVRYRDLIIPITLNVVHDLLGLPLKKIRFSDKLKLFLTEPAASFESDFTLFVGSILIYYSHRVSDIDVHSANY